MINETIEETKFEAQPASQGKVSISTANAGFGIRLAAALLDSLINLLIILAPLVPLSYLLESKVKGITGVSFATISDPTFAAIEMARPFAGVITYFISMFLVSGIIFTLYKVFFVSKFGGTLGKLLFGLRIVDQSTNEFLNLKRAFFRQVLGYAFSGVLVGLGFFRIIKNPDNLGWHDELFDTKVIRRGGVLGGVLAFIVVFIALPVVIYVSGSTIFSSFMATDLYNQEGIEDTGFEQRRSI